MDGAYPAKASRASRPVPFEGLNEGGSAAIRHVQNADIVQSPGTTTLVARARHIAAYLIGR
jgi:hypothetical protein